MPTAPRVFLTGGTGYVGGSLLARLAERHPSWQVTCLVRSLSSANDLRSQFPHINIIHGDLDSTSTIETSAASADIVFHLADADHLASAAAIARGLRTSSLTGAKAKRYWIHLSGAMILAHETVSNNSWGSESVKIYDDWKGISDLTITMPEYAEHRTVDHLVLSSGSERVKTAIVAPPLIYARGIGKVGNRRSVQIERVAEAYLKHKRAFVIQRGQNRWNVIHIEDLVALLMRLGEVAIETMDCEESPLEGSHQAREERSDQLWNEGGYYLAENGEHSWREIGENIRAAVNGLNLVSIDVMEELTDSEAVELMRGAKYLMGTNSRGRALRARHLLGWEAQKGSLMEEIPTIVEREAVRMGLTSEEG